MLAYVVLSALAGITLAADQLRACCDVVARLADRHLAAACHDHGGIFVSLNDGIERGGVEAVVRVDFATADADALDVDENLVFVEVFSLGSRNFLKLDVLWGC